MTDAKVYEKAELKTATLRIWRGTSLEDGHYETFEVQFEEGESILDGLVRLRYGRASDLAFQFSCFNANVCKECTVAIDGVVDYACIAKLKTGVTQLDPLPDQMILRDLLIDTRDRERKGETLRRQVQSMSDGKRRAGRRVDPMGPAS